jgi:hypothetical protein
MQELAYEVADGTIVNLMPARAVVRPPDGRRCLAIVWTLCDAGDELTARRALISYALSRPYAAHFERLGFGAVVTESARLRDVGRLRDAPAMLPDELVELLFATPDTLPARLEGFRRAGAEPLVLPLPGSGPADEVLRAVQGLMQQLSN